MRYHYFYQTSRNESLEGWINAKDRNDAYTQLRKQGIKPYKLIGRNPLAWKRWAAIGVLAAVVVILSLLQISNRPTAVLEEPRSQLYGDPAIIQQLSADGWRRTFADGGDAWFARHAIPASVCDCPSEGVELTTKPLAIGAEDSPELAKMKRMVNGMKREVAEYVRGGGSVEDYMALCDERLATERGLVESYKRDFERLEKKGGDTENEWEKKNAELRSMGLPTLPMPEADE